MSTPAGETSSCSPGEGACPPDIDCVGSWSECAASCDDKVYSVATAQSGQGSSCAAADGDTAPCAPGERAGSIRAWWREREQMLAPDRSVTLIFPSGQGFVVSRLQIVAPDCSVTLIFPSGQPVVPRGRLGPRAAAPASGAPATATESSSVAARDRRRRAHGRIDAASRGSLPSRAAPNHSCTTRRQAMRLCLRCELCRAAVEQSRPAPHQGGLSVFTPHDLALAC